MSWKADTKAYLCFYSSCPTLVSHRLEKVCYTFNLHEVRKKISSQFDEKLTLHQVHSCFLNLFGINIIASHSNQPSFLPLELIDRFLYEAKIDLKLIKNQLCKAKMSVMRIEARAPATSKMEFFAVIIKKQKLLNTVSRAPS